jgi:Protein of unknown function (DUF3105)
MAKKKRKKQRRPQQGSPAPAGPAVTTAEERTTSRQERKEQARRDRERRIREARRRQRMRKLARWGIAAAVVLGVGGFIFWQTQQGRELEADARAAANRLNCGPVETQQEEVDAAAALDQQTLHSPPFAQGQDGVPVTAGAHSSPLPPEPAVYEQSIPEENAVHNLEHGYVLIYYAAEGQNRLSENIRSQLEEVAGREEKVLMAPYPNLAASLDLVAWGQLQTCKPPEDADPEDAATVADFFISRFRSGGLAPEPNGV